MAVPGFLHLPVSTLSLPSPRNRIFHRLQQTDYWIFPKPLASCLSRRKLYSNLLTFDTDLALLKTTVGWLAAADAPFLTASTSPTALDTFPVATVLKTSILATDLTNFRATDGLYQIISEAQIPHIMCPPVQLKWIEIWRKWVDGFFSPSALPSPPLHPYHGRYHHLLLQYPIQQPIPSKNTLLICLKWMFRQLHNIHILRLPGFGNITELIGCEELTCNKWGTITPHTRSQCLARRRKQGLGENVRK